MLPRLDNDRPVRCVPFGHPRPIDPLAVIAEDVLLAVPVGVDRPGGAVGEGAEAEQAVAHEVT